MGTYFHGWQRKFGAATLLMACVLAAGWLRSLRTVDDTAFNLGDRLLFQLISREQAVSVRTVKSDLPVKKLSVERVLLLGFQAPQGNSTGNLAINVDEATRVAEGATCRWIIKNHGFEMSDITDSQFAVKVLHVRVPYWSIVIPLTLLSTWLLLGKPRMKNLDPDTAKIS